MDFESALKFLKNFVSYEDLAEFDYNEENFNLKRVRKFLDEYEVDYSKLKYVHTAGSKGKGSVCSLIASYLSEAGYKTGLFTSPYMFDIRESFWLDGENISKEKFVKYVEELKNFIDSNSDFGLTYFELLTVLVLKYFVDENVDFAVVEVGLGGRLDATNIIIPELSVITTVEKEHEEVLGESLSEILWEKLGIVKEGIPVLIGYQSGEGEDLIKKKLKGKKKIYFVEDFSENYKDLKLRSLSRVQVKNGEVAYSALMILLDEVDKKVFKKVFDNFKLVGRFDIRKIQGKTVVFDIAHTAASTRNLVESLKSVFPEKNYVFLVSIMRGKDVYSILDEISSVAEKVIFTSSHKDRGYSGSELEAFSSGTYCEVIEEPGIAYKKGLEELEGNQVFIVTGSHFLVDKALRMY